MSARILIAGLLGAIVMYVWASIAHMLLPVSAIGFSQIPNEAPVLAAMQSSIGDQPGLYFFPWVDPKDPNMMQKEAALTKIHPSGIMVYHPPGGAVAMSAGNLIGEFVKEFVQCLIAAFLLGAAIAMGYWARVGFVTLIGVAAVITTNVSYWMWYGFPLDYTVTYMLIDLVGYIGAGLAIAWWMGRARAA